MNSEWSKHSQSGNKGYKTFTFCQNGRCCSTGSLPAMNEEYVNRCTLPVTKILSGKNALNGLIFKRINYN